MVQRMVLGQTCRRRRLRTGGSSSCLLYLKSHSHQRFRWGLHREVELADRFEHIDVRLPAAGSIGLRCLSDVVNLLGYIHLWQ